MSCLLSGISFDFQRLLNSVIDAKQFNIAFNLLTKMNNENDQFFCDESMRFIPTLRLIHNLILNKNLSKVIQLISCFENKIIRIDLFLETYILLSNNNDDSSLNKISSLITLDISHIKFKNYLYRLVLHKTNNIEKKEHINHLFSIVENFKASEISKASLNNKSTFDDSYDKIFNNYDSREYNKELEKDLINHNSKLKDELDLFFKSSEELPEKVDRGISLIYNKIFDIDLELANKVFEKTIKIISEYTFDEPNRCSSLKDYINNSIIKNNPDYILDAAKLITNAGNTYFNIFKFFAQNEDFESCMKTSSKLFFFEIDFKNNLEIQDKYFDSLIKLFDSNKDLTLKIIKNTNHNGYVITSYCPKKYNSNNVKYYNNSIWIQKIYCRLAIYLIKTQNDYISFYKLLDLIDDLEIKNECLKDAIDLVTIFGDKNSVFQLMDKQFIFKNKKINDNLIVENYFLSKIETINNQEIFTLINKTNDDDLNLYNQKRNKTIDNLIYKLIKYPKNYSLDI